MSVPTAPPVEGSLLARPRPWLIGVIHLPALPGAPDARLSVDAIVDQAVQDARCLQGAGFTAVMVENFHDSPFHADDVGPETIASLALVGHAVKRSVGIPVGLNVLRNDALAALGISVATGCPFVRINVLAGVAATDQGLVTGRAAEWSRRARALGWRPSVLADVDVKHATSLDTRPLPARARDLVSRAGADAVLVTGDGTGRPCDLDALAAVRDAVAPAPVLAASGTTVETVREVLTHCDGVVVGSALKDPATGRVCPDRASAFAQATAT